MKIHCRNRVSSFLRFVYIPETTEWISVAFGVLRAQNVIKQLSDKFHFGFHASNITQNSHKAQSLIYQISQNVSSYKIFQHKA
jgi:hypothetical protein